MLNIGSFRISGRSRDENPDGFLGQDYRRCPPANGLRDPMCAEFTNVIIRITVILSDRGKTVPGPSECALGLRIP